MTIHPNSAAAAAAFRESGANAEREREVLFAYVQQGFLTDREVARSLGYDDMNAVRPTITRLVQEGRLREVGTKKCRESGRTVRVCAMSRCPNGHQIRPHETHCAAEHCRADNAEPTIHQEQES